MSYTNLKEYYLTKEEVKQALAIYNADRPEEEHKFYIPYYEEWNRRNVYIPCEREFYYWWRNDRRKEQIKEIREERCKVPSKKYGFKRCTADCRHCPYKQDPNNPEQEVVDYIWTGKPLSLDAPIGCYDDDDPIYIEVADDAMSALEGMIEKESKAERKALLEETLCELPKADRAMVLLYYGYSKSDAEISRIVGVPRATVQRRRIKAFELLKKKLSEK